MGVGGIFSHHMLGRQASVGQCGFTRMLSWMGLWPEPPPTFSGLKVTLGWHMNGGFRTYPH